MDTAGSGESAAWSPPGTTAPAAGGNPSDPAAANQIKPTTTPFHEMSNSKHRIAFAAISATITTSDMPLHFHDLRQFSFRKWRAAVGWDGKHSNNDGNEDKSHSFPELSRHHQK